MQSYREYQDYTKPVDSMDRFDTFYACVCNPIHCLDVGKLFEELEELQENVRQQRLRNHSIRTIMDSDQKQEFSDLVPFSAFMEYIQNSQLWQRSGLRKQEQFIRLLSIEDLFLKVKIIEQVPQHSKSKANPRKTTVSPEPFPKRKKMDHRGFDSDVESEDYIEDILEGLEGDDDESTLNSMARRMRAQANLQQGLSRRTQNCKMADAGDLLDQKSDGSIEKIPQLHKLFTDDIEPCNKQKIMVQTGPDLRLVTYNKDGVQVKHVYKQKKGSESSEQEDVPAEEHLFDLFVFKVFALLMCRGTKLQKTNILMDLVSRPSAQNNK